MTQDSWIYIHLLNSSFIKMSDFFKIGKIKMETYFICYLFFLEQMKSILSKITKFWVKMRDKNSFKVEQKNSFIF